MHVITTYVNIFSLAQMLLPHGDFSGSHTLLTECLVGHKRSTVHPFTPLPGLSTPTWHYHNLPLSQHRVTHTPSSRGARIVLSRHAMSSSEQLCQDCGARMGIGGATGATGHTQSGVKCVGMLVKAVLIIQVFE